MYISIYNINHAPFRHLCQKVQSTSPNASSGSRPRCLIVGSTYLLGLKQLTGCCWREPWKWIIHLDVSKNSGTPKSSISIGFSIINHPFWGTPILETPIFYEWWCFVCFFSRNISANVIVQLVVKQPPIWKICCSLKLNHLPRVKHEKSLKPPPSCCLSCENKSACCLPFSLNQPERKATEDQNVRTPGSLRQRPATGAV